MNALEDQLREALAERAARSPIDEDAWDKTVARSRRRLRLGLRLALPGWLPPGLAIPAAAAAAVTGIVLAAISLTGVTHGAAPGPGGSPAATTSPPPGTPREVTDVLRIHPAVTAIVLAKLGGTRVYIWFSDLKTDYGCAVALGTPGYSCYRWPSGWSEPAVLGTGIGEIIAGKAVQQITSVTAQRNDGSSAPAVLVSGRDFPFKVWFASVPPGYSAILAFSDAAGHQITSFGAMQGASSGSLPGHGGITVDGWTAYLTGGGVLWSGPDSATVSIGSPVKQKPLLVTYGETGSANYALGYAPADVARLVLRMPDGHEYGGPTVPGWPGSGERLWVHGGLPHGGLPAGTLVISYDAAGKVIAQQPAGL